MRLEGPPARYLRHLRKRVDGIERLSPAWLARGLDSLGKRPFKSFSFYGEDALVHGFLQRAKFEETQIENLSYVDIGAWRPVAGSNTYWLYRQGARGTLVEPNAHMVSILRAARPEDEMLALACARTPTVDFYSFGPYAESNTTSAQFAADVSSSQGHQVERVSVVAALSLDEILDFHQEHFGGLFLLSIDAEGTNGEILMSTNWRSVPARPKFIISEVDALHSPDPLLLNDSALIDCLTENRYALLAVCGVSLVFVERDFVNG